MQCAWAADLIRRVPAGAGDSIFLGMQDDAHCFTVIASVPSPSPPRTSAAAAAAGAPTSAPLRKSATAAVAAAPASVPSPVAKRQRVIAPNAQSSSPSPAALKRARSPSSAVGTQHHRPLHAYVAVSPCSCSAWPGAIYEMSTNTPGLAWCG
jgi:hypothetical protein